MNIKGIFFFGVKNGVKGWRENGVKYGVYTILVQKLHHFGVIGWRWSKEQAWKQAQRESPAHDGSPITSKALASIGN